MTPVHRSMACRQRTLYLLACLLVDRPICRVDGVHSRLQEQHGCKTRGGGAAGRGVTTNCGCWWSCRQESCPCCGAGCMFRRLPRTSACALRIVTCTLTVIVAESVACRRVHVVCDDCVARPSLLRVGVAQRWQGSWRCQGSGGGGQSTDSSNMRPT